MLWSYITTPHNTTGETPFRMVYWTDAIIPVEIGQPSWRVMYPAEDNEQLLREDCNLIDKVREIARIKVLSRKQQIAQRYNLKVVKRNFQRGDLIMRKACIGNRNAKDGKLKANWEGPYRVKSSTTKGAYHLETLKGKELPRTFNVVDLRRYYSSCVILTL